jgi:hypothetical protein
MYGKALVIKNRVMITDGCWIEAGREITGARAPVQHIRQVARRPAS